MAKRKKRDFVPGGILGDLMPPEAPPPPDARCRNCQPLPCVELLRLPLPPPAVPRPGRPRGEWRLVKGRRGPWPELRWFPRLGGRPRQPRWLPMYEVIEDV